MKYDSKIHHRKSIRLKNYDYSENGYYFVTICTKNRECWFGDIVDGKMVLSEIGNIVQQHWNDIPKHFHNVLLDIFVVMPNHLHGIIIIDRETAIDHVGAYHDTPLQQIFRSPSNNLGSIIRGFKSAVKRWCNKNGHEYFGWQRNYYEHIIRNENEYELDRIREYIIDNPLKWEFDFNNPIGAYHGIPLQRTHLKNISKQ